LSVLASAVFKKPVVFLKNALKILPEIVAGGAFRADQPNAKILAPAGRDANKAHMEPIPVATLRALGKLIVHVNRFNTVALVYHTFLLFQKTPDKKL